MGLLDSLMDAASGSQPAANASGAAGGLDPQMIMGIAGALLNNAGGLSGLLDKLQQGGLAEAVQSWVGTGANQPVSADALGSALGPDFMRQLAQNLGGDQQQTAGTLADLLPGLIDRLTPQGQLPADNGLGALAGLLGGGGAGGAGGNAADLMGMLGGLLKK